MDLKKSVLIFSFIILFTSIIAVSANTDYTYTDHDIQSIMENYNESDMTGCCSIVLQLEGNNSIMSFRRDAGNAADITIEKINWHGKEAIRQYKTAGGYFCQVIITNDGWTVGYGGIDDGVDNERIENITGNMIANSSGNISESVLQQIQDIKASYGLGHIVVKSPDGNYGYATATTHSMGKLKPGEYISLPNKISFLRTGNVALNASDKVKTMTELEQSDGFGITRRDITTFVFTCLDNGTNVTDVYLSNDDGSYYGMSTAGLVDNVNFTGKYTEASKIPIAPTYMSLGNVTFEPAQSENGGGGFGFLNILLMIVAVIIIGIVAFFAYHLVRVIRYRNRYRRR